MKSRSLFITLTLVLFIMDASSQERIVFKDARMKTGVQQEWKEKSYDDKDWETVRLNQEWDSQGLSDHDGFGFYRMHFNLPSAMLQHAYLKDSLIIYLGKIDDADEVYLNGQLIGKTGHFPEEPGGYQSAWGAERFYKIAAKHPAIEWDKENLLSIKVYDGSGTGGMYEGFPYIKMVELVDALPIAAVFDEKNGDVCTISLTNGNPVQMSGNFKVDVLDTEFDKPVKTFSQKIKLASARSFVKNIPYSTGKRYCLKIEFRDDRSGQVITKNVIVPYILTPKASEAPKINGAKVFGVRPGSPFLFKIPASGQKPIKYSVEGLPAGLAVDATTGVITGVLETAGEYKMNFVAENSKGKDTRAFTIKVGNLLALTPPMGWNSWNCWGLSVSNDKVRSSAQAMIDKGLIDYGWMYINIDDAWENNAREADGTIHANDKFPDMKALGDWLHGNGLRFGVYSSPGAFTCGRYLGSYGYEKQDADQYAAWGVDYLKYDWCDYNVVYEREGDQSLSAHLKPYQVMEKALRAQKRDIVYSLCQYGMRDVWQWGAAVDGNLWRTTGDITDTWTSLKEIGFQKQAELHLFAKPGRWNDPDMLIVGKLGWSSNLRQTRLTCDEQYTHISLWCLLSAPLLIGCDISQLDRFTLGLLTNAEVIAVDQDPLGQQAKRVIADNDKQVWTKKLEDGSYAVGIFNLGTEDAAMTVKWSELGLPENVHVRDLWMQKDLGVSNGLFEKKVPSHGVVLLKVK